MIQSDRTSLAAALLVSLLVHVTTLATIIPRGHDTLPVILSVYLPKVSERSAEAPRASPAPAEETVEPRHEAPALRLERRHSVASAAPARPRIVEPARPVPQSTARVEAAALQPAVRPSAETPAETMQPPPAAAPAAAAVAQAPAAPSTQLAVAPEASAAIADERFAASALKSYGQAISTILDRYKAYPLDARLHGWQGAAMIRLRVAPSGLLLGAELERSSGHEILDRKALAIAAEVRQLPAPPKELGDRELVITVPIVFRFQSD